MERWTILTYECGTKHTPRCKAGQQHDALMALLRQDAVLHFLPCPLLQFMDSTFHTTVSSSHTAEVQSSPGEVRHLPS